MFILNKIFFILISETTFKIPKKTSINIEKSTTKSSAQVIPKQSSISIRFATKASQQSPEKAQKVAVVLTSPEEAEKVANALDSSNEESESLQTPTKKLAVASSSTEAIKAASEPTSYQTPAKMTAVVYSSKEAEKGEAVLTSPETPSNSQGLKLLQAEKLVAEKTTSKTPLKRASGKTSAEPHAKKTVLKPALSLTATDDVFDNEASDVEASVNSKKCSTKNQIADTSSEEESETNEDDDGEYNYVENLWQCLFFWYFSLK